MKKPAKKKHKKPAKKKQTTAIVKAELLPPNTAIRQGHAHTLNKAEIDLLKRTVAKGTTDDEFALFLLICRKHKVDPFIGQIHCAKFPVSKHHKEKKIGAGGGEIEVWVSGEQMVIMMGINGYRSIAARNHSDFGGCSLPKFVMSDQKTPAQKCIPISCSIQLWKKGLEHPIEAEVFWEEFAPKDLNETRADFWNRMPKHKLAIVAESHALRKGYPDLSNIYTEEEMDQHTQDFTPGGRQIVEEDGRAPSGRVVDYQHTSRGDAQAVAAAKQAGEWCEKHSCHKSVCPADEHTQAENEAWEAHLRGKQPTGAQGNANRQPGASAAEPTGQPPAPSTSRRIIVVRWSADKKFAAIDGDPVAIKFLERDFQRWNAEFLTEEKRWCLAGEFVVSLEERCSISGFGFQENSVTPSNAPDRTEAAGSAVGGSSPGYGDSPSVGKVEQFRTTNKDGKPYKTKDKGNPYISIRYLGDWHFCFNPDLWDYLKAAHVGQFDSVLILKKVGDFSNVVGIKRIGSREFDKDGKTMIVQMSEDRPKAGQLFA